MSIKIIYLVLGISLTLISCTNNEKNDLFVQSNLNIKDMSENLISTQITFQTESHESLNLEKFKLIGIVNSYDPKNSQALLRIGEDKPSIFKENQYIDRDVKLLKINKESILISRIDNLSDAKFLYLTPGEANKDLASPSEIEQRKLINDNYSKASYMEDVFREGFTKFKNSQEGLSK